MGLTAEGNPGAFKPFGRITWRAGVVHFGVLLTMEITLVLTWTAGGIFGIKDESMCPELSNRVDAIFSVPNRLIGVRKPSIHKQYLVLWNGAVAYREILMWYIPRNMYLNSMSQSLGVH